MKKSIEISRPIIWSEVPKEIKQFSFSKFKKSLKRSLFKYIQNWDRLSYALNGCH